MNLSKNSLEGKEIIINNDNKNNLTRYKINYTYGGSENEEDKKKKKIINEINEQIWNISYFKKVQVEEKEYEFFILENENNKNIIFINEDQIKKKSSDWSGYKDWNSYFNSYHKDNINRFIELLKNLFEEEDINIKINLKIKIEDYKDFRSEIKDNKKNLIGMGVQIIEINIVNEDIIIDKNSFSDENYKKLEKYKDKINEIKEEIKKKKDEEIKKIKKIKDWQIDELIKNEEENKITNLILSHNDSNYFIDILNPIVGSDKDNLKVGDTINFINKDYIKIENISLEYNEENEKFVFNQYIELNKQKIEKKN